MALERCICVVLPMKAATLMSTRAMWAVIVFVVVLLQVAGAGTLTAKFQVRCGFSGASRFIQVVTSGVIFSKLYVVIPLKYVHK